MKLDQNILSITQPVCCKFIDCERLDESRVNSLDEKKTSVNFKPFNLASGKGSKRLIYLEIMMGLFLNGHNSFCKVLENIAKDIVFP